MSARKEYEMTVEQRDRILEACKPVPAMYLSGGAPMYRSQQENANDAWQALATELGFKWDTIRPVPGKSDLFISAEPL